MDNLLLRLMLVCLCLGCLCTGCGQIGPSARCIGERLSADETLDFVLAPYADCEESPVSIQSVKVYVDGQLSSAQVSISAPAGIDQPGPRLRLLPPSGSNRVNVIVRYTQAARQFVMIIRFCREGEDSLWLWRRSDESISDLGEISCREGS